MPDAGSPSPHDPIEPKRADLCLVADAILRRQAGHGAGTMRLRYSLQQETEAVLFLKKLGILKEVPK